MPLLNGRKSPGPCQAGRRIISYLEERVAGSGDPRSAGKALTGPLGGFWRYRVEDDRVVCKIQDGRLCVLEVRLGNRKQMYR